LKKLLDEVFSKYTRQKRADWRGYNRCFTCGAMRLWKELQAGHYESRVFNSLRYNETNVQVQCRACNIFKQGNKTIFAVNLVRDYGPAILEDLRKQAQIAKQFTKQELKGLIAEYNEKIKQLEYGSH